jgi:tryptophan synthase beta chain
MPETKILLPERDMPRQWYNISPDLPVPMQPPLHPGTLQPMGPQDLAPLFPMECIKQEVSQDRFIDIPDEVRKAYSTWRPTPLYRAWRFEKALDTPAKIYYKWEGVSPPGSHKPNTSVPQAFYNKAEGIKRLTTETGAGQWGSALSFACGLFGLECTVYMVRVSYQQKPYRKSLIRTWGADVFPSPSDKTQAGRAFLAKDANHPGSLGIAISEAVEDAATHDDAHYSIGSVVNHVLLHQSIIGMEAKKQMEMAGDYPDVVIACVGGGSNFGGFCYPFLADRLQGKKKNLRAIAAEPKACPTLTKGTFCYDFGDTARMAPVLPMYTLGHDFVPAGIHAGGLRYHGDSPTLSLLVREKVVEAVAYHQNPVFEAAVTFARSEGFVPAPETAHAIKAVVDEAEAAKKAGEKRVIAFNCSGHGDFDLGAYDAYFAGELEDYELPQAEIDKALAGVPKV